MSAVGVPFLAGKAALVTGSTSGMGFAIVKALARAGASVTMTGLGSEEAIAAKLSEAQNEGEVFYHPADLLRPKEIRDLVDESRRRRDRLDILVNNAGCQHVAPVDEFPEDQWDRLIAVNLSAAFHATSAAIPGMREAGWGRIINTGSMHSLVASPYKSAYNAAKHGIAGLTKTVALELAQTGITCNAICPGYTWTELIENQLEDTAKVRGITPEQVVSDVLLADQPIKRFVKVEEIAGLVRFLCTDDAAAITGSMLSMDGGWTAR